MANRVDEDNVRVVDFPQHLLNASFRTASSVQYTSKSHVASFMPSITLLSSSSYLRMLLWHAAMLRH